MVLYWNDFRSLNSHYFRVAFKESKSSKSDGLPIVISKLQVTLFLSVFLDLLFAPCCVVRWSAEFLMARN